jgi:hypothetical protein
MRIALLSAPLLALLAPLGCVGADGGADDTADTDADTDADADTDTDVDFEPGVCGGYAGLRAVGQTWSWRFDEEQAAEIGAGTWTTTLTAFTTGDTRTDFTVSTDAVYAVEGFDEYTTTTTTTGYCDADGVWSLGSTGHTHYVFDGRAGEIDGTTTYDAPRLSLPAGLGPGSTWTVEESGTTTTTGVPDNNFSNSYDYEAGEIVSVTVPAGTYDALEVVGSTDRNQFSFWLDYQVGAVATDTTELVSYGD